ncbi:hypothetical protein F0726_02498 [Acidithiobacillus caldus]|nr:hypothetical protein F0726_02498 [Acidithiobacillus caldus]
MLPSRWRLYHGLARLEPIPGDLGNGGHGSVIGMVR